MPTNPNPSMTPHPHHHMPPHIYPRIPPHQVCLCPYFTSTPFYAPYVVPHCPYIPSVGFLHTSSSKIPSSVLPPYSSKEMSEYRKKRMNRISNEMNNNKEFQWVEKMQKTVTFFQYQLIDHMNIREKLSS